MTTHTIMTLIDQYGYFAVIFLIALENVFPPIPSEIILTFTGFLTISTSMTVWGAIIASTVGAVLGAIILYAIGRIASPERLNRFLGTRFGRLLRLKPTDIEKAARFFNRHGNGAILFGRFVPVIRSLISIPAGMSGFPLGRFLALSTVGTLIWNTVLIYAGSLAGNHWQAIVTQFEIYSHWLLIAVIIALAIVSLVWFCRRRQHLTQTTSKPKELD